MGVDEKVEVVEEAIHGSAAEVSTIPLSSEVCTDWEKVVMGTKGGGLVRSWVSEAEEPGGEKARGL